MRWKCVHTGIENPQAAFQCMKRNLRGLKICGFSGRPADLRKCFLHQCSHWLWKRIPTDKSVGMNVVRRDADAKAQEGAGAMKKPLLSGQRLLSS
jgi:hypothetical protein